MIRKHLAAWQSQKEPSSPKNKSPYEVCSSLPQACILTLSDLLCCAVLWTFVLDGQVLNASAGTYLMLQIINESVQSSR